MLPLVAGHTHRLAFCYTIPNDSDALGIKPLPKKTVFQIRGAVCDNPRQAIMEDDMPKKTTKPEPKKLRTIGFQCADDLVAAIETERAKMREAQPGNRVAISDCVRALLMAGIAAVRADKRAA